MTTVAFEILSVGWDVFFNFSAILGKVRISSALQSSESLRGKSALELHCPHSESLEKKFISTLHKNLSGLNILMHILLHCSIWIDIHNNHPPCTPSGERWKQRPAEIQCVCSVAKQGLCRAYGHIAMDSLYIIQTWNLFILSPGFCCAMANPLFWYAALVCLSHFSSFPLEIISLFFSFVLCSLSSSILSVIFPSLINVLLLFTIK